MSNRISKGFDLRDEVVRLAAAQHLGNLGSRAVEAIPALVNAMEDADVEVALAVCAALKQIGNPGIPYLLKFMRNAQEKEKIRWYAAEALADLGPESLPHLLKAMDDQDVGVRMMAIDSIPRLGFAAESAVPRIEKFLSENNVNIIKSSTISLAQIAMQSADPSTSLAMRTLLNSVKSENVDLRRAVVSAIEYLGDKIAGLDPILHTLKEASQDRDEEVRENAAWLLNRLGRPIKTSERGQEPGG